MSRSGKGGKKVPRVRLPRSFGLQNKALEAFYERRYDRAVELCQEALSSPIPGDPDRHRTPEEEGALFLKTYSSSLPAQEAERIFKVFTFFQNRRARFQFDRGKPLPHREWWQLLHVTRDEADEILTITRLALEAIKKGPPPS